MNVPPSRPGTRRKSDEIMYVKELHEAHCAEHMQRVIILGTHRLEKDEGVPFQMGSI